MKNSTAIHPDGDTDVDGYQIIQGCRNCVEQCDQLMQLLTPETFIQSSPGLSSIGAHMRHILDRFQCLFTGLQSNFVDYDDRERDPLIENNLDVASSALASLARCIDDLDMNVIRGKPITVRETVHHERPVIESSSTVDRELMGLITHSIHHIAIVALLAKPLGLELGGDFGKAPSTILYERGSA